ncbi:heavy metal translocating P-type ATPase [Candidatus Collierbacteria bacterium]|nr:heavy metal translocating P-type ATPase [Candidatus Collierbacteria bacterium]
MIYTCPMHPEIKQDHPGKCPKCGGMDLVLQHHETHGSHATHESHDHSAMMAGPQAAGDFLRRFLIVTLLLAPLIATSKLGIKFMGMPDFAGRNYVEFTVATAIFYFGLVFFQHARHEWMARKYGMMTLVSLAVGAGYLFSAASTFIPSLKTEFYLEISTLIWVLLFGHFLEAKSSTAAGDALKEVAKLLPKQAHRIRTKDEGRRMKAIEDVDIEELKAGDAVLVKPGEKVPADGVILVGAANFNESHITGESRPVSRKPGDRTIAGAICLDGSVEVRLDKVGDNSTIGQIKQLISQAQQTKPTVQKIADKAASILTFTALGVGLTALIYWSLIAGQPLVFGLTLAITVLVIACPHALGLAIPTVSTIATTLAVKNGVFLKDLAKLEVIKKATYVIFDKTGTLTKGEFGVTKIVSFERPGLAKQGQALIEQVAASLEVHSSHVIGLSIVKYAKEKGISAKPVVNFKNLAGKGAEGTIGKMKYAVGNLRLMEEKKLLVSETKETYRRLADAGDTTVFIADEKRVLGLISLSDQVKPESAQTINNLHRLGVKAAMVTGDNRQVAEGVGKQLGIDTVFAEVLPADKYKYVRELQDKGEIVVMVGDGVNDAPALKQANVGVAIGAGTDVAVEAGDVVLTRSNPEDVAKLVILSRKVYRKMIENLLWATGYNVLAIPAAAGLFIPWGFRLTPGLGAFLMSLSSVIVVINAMALKKVRLNA